MKIKEITENLFTYIQANRRTGNTTLLIEGAKSYNKPFYVLGWSAQHASQKIKQYGLELAKPLSIYNLDSARGINLPLAIDADIMGWLMGKVAHEFDQIELKHDREKIKFDQDVRKYAAVANELMTKVKDQQKVLINRGELLIKIGQMSWWERTFLAPRLIHQLFQLELKNN